MKILALLSTATMCLSLAATAADKYKSPYMGAKNTKLFEIANGAKVTQETYDYWNLPEDSDQRVSYDKLTTIKVADGVWTFGSGSIVNTHAIEAPRGIVLFDTGDSAKDAEEFYQLLRKVTDKPIKAIIYSHEHYTTGSQTIVEEEKKRGNTDIMVIGHPNTNKSMSTTAGLSAMYPEVSPTLLARTLEQFNMYLAPNGPDSGFKNTVIPSLGGFVPVNKPVKDGEKVDVAGLEMVFYTTDVGTDTNNQVLTYVPSKKLVFNNIIWGWFPNIYSARGGKFRDPNDWVNAISKIKALKPEILLSTHSTSLVGAEKITQRLQDFQDGLAFVLDQTLKGIAKGMGPDELRYFVQMPEYLQKKPILVQNYGEVSTMPPRIFTALFGQFDGDAVNLNKLHPTDEAQRMITAMGGAGSTYSKAKKAYDDGDYLWSAQLASYLVRAQPDQKNKQLKANALRQMAYRTVSTNSRSWYLSQARELEGKTTIAKFVPVMPTSVVNNLADYVNYYRIRVNPAKSQRSDELVKFNFGKDSFGLHVRGAVVDFIPAAGIDKQTAKYELSMKPESWVKVFNNTDTIENLIKTGEIKVTKGDRADVVKVMGYFDPLYDWAKDPALKELSKSKNKSLSMAE